MLQKINNKKFISYILQTSIVFALSIISGQLVAETHTTIRVASTTSAANSGLMDILQKEFEAEHSFKLDVFASGSGNSLRRLRVGKADLAITHAPKAELKLIQDGYILKRKPLMTNEFVIVGPESDPAGIADASNTLDVLRKISTASSSFISRGDDSGTHKKELNLWKRAGIEPYGNWYIETGAGMGKAMRIASQKQSYIMTDSGTWLALRSQLKLKLLFRGDKILVNPYSVSIADPEKHPDTNYKGAKAFMDWLLSAKGKKIISSFKVDGETLFSPAD